MEREREKMGAYNHNDLSHKANLFSIWVDRARRAEQEYVF